MCRAAHKIYTQYPLNHLTTVHPSNNATSLLQNAEENILQAATTKGAISLLKRTGI